MKIIDAPLSEIMEVKFIDYAREVIGDRALPDVRDGLKPVHRRILWAMYEGKYLPEGRFRKSARVVGDVMAQYHPHGDSSIYGAMVKQIQPFVRRLPMISGQGNFGTIDDNPAAMRYTEAKLSPASIYLLEGIKKEIVPFVDNYDGEKQEPKVLPARIPHLLINGTSGIAVGMTSDILPHNPGETIEATLLLLEKPQASTKELMKKLPGPDFPTGALISNEDLATLYDTGHGVVVGRGEVIFEEAVKTRNIVIQSLPYQCSMDNLLRKIAQLVEKNYIDHVKDLRDESSELIGTRVVIEVSKDLDATKFVEALYAKTPLEKRFTSHMVALVDNKPKVLNLKRILQEFIKFRHETLVAYFKDRKNSLEKKLHILYALEIASKNIDQVISIIRKSNSTADAKQALMKKFSLDSTQAQAVLDLRLAKLTKLEVKDLRKEIGITEGDLAVVVEYLSSKEKRTQYIQKELRKIKKEFSEDVRKTKIISFADKEYVPDVKDDKVVLQATGNKIRKKDESFTGKKGIILKTDLSKVILVFLENGQCLRQTVGYIPDKFESKIVAMVDEAHQDPEGFFLVCYSNGFVKKSNICDMKDQKSPFSFCKRKGDCHVRDVKFVSEKDSALVLVADNGYAICFNIEEINPTGLIGIGVVCLRIPEGNVIESIYFPRELKKDQEELKNMPKQKRGGKGKHIFKE